MKKEERIDLYNKTVEKWGFDAQLEMIEEECLELALAIQKFKRKSGNTIEKYNNIINEIADVKIMIEQAEIMFPKDKIDNMIKYKLNRLKERIEK